MKGVPAKSVLIAAVLSAFIATSAHANPISVWVGNLYDDWDEHDFVVPIGGVRLVAGDGFTVFDVGGFTGDWTYGCADIIGTVDCNYWDLEVQTGAPYTYGAPLLPDDPLLPNLRFFWTGDDTDIVAALAVFTIGTTANSVALDDWNSHAHNLAAPTTISPAGNSVWVPKVLSVPDGGSAIVLLGFGFLAIGALRRKFLT